MYLTALYKIYHIKYILNKMSLYDKIINVTPLAPVALVESAKVSANLMDPRVLVSLYVIVQVIDGSRR